MAVTISSGTVQNGSSYNTDGETISVYGTANNFTVDHGATIIALIGGITNNTTINQNGFERIMSGGYTSGSIINSGGTQSVSSGGISEAAAINSGGAQVISTGATTNGATINGGDQTLAAGSIANDTVIVNGSQTVALRATANRTVVNGGFQQVTILGVANNTVVNNSGRLYNDQGTVSAATVNSGGYLAVYGGGGAQTRDVTINAGGQEEVGINIRTQRISVGSSYNAQIHGSQFVYSGSIAENAIIFDGGYQDIKNGATVSGTIVSSGGLLNIEDGGTIEGIITLENGGLATIYSNAGGAINLVGDTNGGLTISGLADGGEVTTVITVISGFNGQNTENSDIIKLAGINLQDVKNVDYVDAGGNSNNDYVTFTLTNGKKITLNIIGVGNFGYALGTALDGSLTYEVCFLAGAMIRTPNGEKAVEDLRIGDKVLTFDWKHNQEVISSICWVGQKKTTVTHDVPADEAGYPVRILKGAFAEGIPYKDLMVTSEHCFFFGNKFIPARMLINDRSIYYDYTITEYTYYHIETENHSVIWADGALTESYLDTGNRNNFKQHGNLVLFTKPLKQKNWDADGAATLCVQRSIVEPIHNKIAQRAKDTGLTKNCDPLSLTNDPNVHLVTKDGLIIEPHLNKENKYTFLLPENTECVYLRSRTSRPCDVIGSFVDDRRHLGVLVGDIFVLAYNQTYQITEHLSQQNLNGWDILEHGSYRWTNGHAQLNFHEDISEKRILVVDILSSNSYIVNNETNIIQNQNIA